MRILALNPFHTGSHKAFLEGWQRHSRHDFTTLTLPGRHWKWRMRTAAIELAPQVNALAREGHTWDAIWATDMLNLAELIALLDEPLRTIPTILYMHENQLAYPVSRRAQSHAERDLHFSISNAVSTLAATRVWWNSHYNLDSFIWRLGELDPHPRIRLFDGLREQIQSRSTIEPPGIEPPPAGLLATPGPTRAPGPLRIAWAARWEHDKNPEAFFCAIESLSVGRYPFRLTVLGQRFSFTPPIFDEMRELLADHIDHWGYAESRDDYLRALAACDVLVSTAGHEFFGMSVVEAAAVGCVPLVPEGLAYPEVLDSMANPDFFYDSPGALTGILAMRAELAAAGKPPLEPALIDAARARAERYFWPTRAAAMDDAIGAAARA